MLGDIASRLGFIVCIFCGGTAFACVLFYRHDLMKSARSRWTLGIMPPVGGLVLIGILVRVAVYYGHRANDASKPLLRLGVPDWVGVLGVARGVGLMFARRIYGSRYFGERPQVAGDEVPRCDARVPVRSERRRGARSGRLRKRGR